MKNPLPLSVLNIRNISIYKIDQADRHAFFLVLIRLYDREGKRSRIFANVLAMAALLVIVLNNLYSHTMLPAARTRNARRILTGNFLSFTQIHNSTVSDDEGWREFLGA